MVKLSFLRLAGGAAVGYAGLKVSETYQNASNFANSLSDKLHEASRVLSSFIGIKRKQSTERKEAINEPELIIVTDDQKVADDQVALKSSNLKSIGHAKLNNLLFQAFVMKNEGSEVPLESQSFALNGGFSGIIRKLIEVRNILKVVDKPPTLELPHVVVIGSQSSGKSSVLEAIVGHPFLPKGHNMVTKRPLELNLIYTPGLERDYAEFPSLGLGKVHDFGEIRKTLESLNKAVPPEECISESPIELNIFSSKVPDLCLVDLPGYIQVVSRNQPLLLREKISSLCEKYINNSNLILAISAADVDLANSEALKACRRVDPEGKRTIGVVTKLDLVDPEKIVPILSNSEYPLPLGYVGVVCTPDQIVSNAEKDLENKITAAERSTSNLGQVTIGTEKLKRRLTACLENAIRKSLYGVCDAVETDLEECRYQFKVLYNDRPVSAEGYVSNVLGLYKQELGGLASQFSRGFVKNLVRVRLENRLSEICDQYYWLTEDVKALNESTCLSPVWIHSLFSSTSSLTKSGIGRTCTQGLFESIECKIQDIMHKSPFSYHEDILMELTKNIQNRLKQKLYTTIDLVESSIKPLKYQVEYTPQEWKSAMDNVLALMKQELLKSSRNLSAIYQTYGQRRINEVIDVLNDGENSDSTSSIFDKNLISSSKNAAFLNYRVKSLQTRISALQSSSCTKPYCYKIHKEMSRGIIGSFMNVFSKERLFDNLSQGDVLYPVFEVEKSISSDVNDNTGKLLIQKDPCQSLLPEVYLYLLLEKAVSLTSLFVYSEIVQDFLEPIPYFDELQLYHIDSKWIRNFAKQNPFVAEQLRLQERKEALEKARIKLQELLKEVDIKHGN